MKRRHPDIEIARLLVKKKFVRNEEALSALKEQKARAAQKKPRLLLVQLLVKRKVLDVGKLPDIQDEIRRHTYICDTCDARTVLAPSSTRSQALCPRCGSEIAVEPPSRPSGVSEVRQIASSAKTFYPGPPGLETFSKERKAFGRYELLDEVGRGAMGVVYRARHVDLGKEFALKVLLAGEDARDAQIARFRREAAAVQKLRHDGIVPIHDFGAEGEVYFLTMDLVEGGLTLHRMWKDPNLAPPLMERVIQVSKVAHAIDHANSRGVIHRDLKPANVLLAPDGTPKVADFGLAKDAADENALTLSQDRLGTPLFMAPEQVKRGSASVDHRADIWALGVMAFVAATGRYPFRGRTIMSLYMKILNEEPDWTGEASSSPDREGWGKAPSPAELKERLEQDLQETGAATEVASHRGEPVRERPLLQRERPPVPPPFVPPPELEGKDIPRDLRSIIEMALAKDPDRRYDTAGALARDLERFTRGERVKATPPGELSRWLRRARRKGGLAAALLFLVFAPSVLLLWRAQVEKKREAARLARILDAEKATEAVWTQYAGVGNAGLDAYEHAAEDLGAVCSAYPEQPAPFVRRGLALAFTLQPDRARDDFARAQANLEGGEGLPAEFAGAAVLLAWIRGEDARAATLARAGLRRTPGDPRLAVFLARALLRQGNAADAERAIAPLVQPRAPVEVLATAAEVAIAANDLKKASDRAQLAHAAASTDPHATYVVGKVALLAGRLDEAREQLRTARDAFAGAAPQEPRYFYDLARARRMDRKRRDLQGALEAGRLSALLAPWSPVPGFWRADLERKDRKDVARAIAEYDECLARDPCFDEVADIRAELLLARRDPDGLAAAEQRFRAEMLQVHRERAAVDLATILVGQGKLDEARPLLQGLESRSLAVRALLLRAEIEERQGRSGKELMAEFDEKSERRSSVLRRDLIALARARLIAGDAKGALAVLDRSPSEDDPRWAGFGRIPDSKHIVHALRAAALARLEKDEAALEELRQAATRSQSDMAAEATPGVLEKASEFGRLRAAHRLATEER